MVAWLITNKYFISDNFLKLKKLLFDSAKKHGIELKEYNNVNVMMELSKNRFEKPSFVLFWDKDVKLAKYIESEGIKVFNNSESIFKCDDKSLTYIALRNNNIKQPKTIFSPLIYYHNLSDDNDYINFVVKSLGLPFVFKECFGSFGQQVYLIKDIEDFKNKIRSSDVWPYIMQEFISTSFGRDLRVYVVGNKVIGGMLRENKNGDFRANIELGGEGSKYEINDKQKEMALSVVRSLGLDFAGVDLLFGENEEPILCEVNSNAYFIGFDKATGVNAEDYIFEYILDNINVPSNGIRGITC